jgi:hypothetical protein
MGSLFAASLSAAVTNPIHGQVVAPSTWATNIIIEPQPRDTNGMPVGSPSSAAFNDWDSVPLALTDPADNPSELNLIDIKDVKIANDANLLYVYASGHQMRTNGLYLAFDTDQDVSTGFNVFGLGLVGSELGYVNDFVFDQRTPGVFNDNKPDGGGSCCTGGPLELNNGGAAMYPGWDVEFDEREWGVPLDAVWSANEPLGPTFPNATFNLILWTDQGVTDVTDAITYTLATPPAGAPGDYNDNGSVDAADYVVWRDGGPLQNETLTIGSVTGEDYDEWRAHFGSTAGSGSSTGLAGSLPEPTTVCSLMITALLLPRHRARRGINNHGTKGVFTPIL